MFAAPKLTNAGKALYYQNLGGTAIKFTTIQLGDGTMSGTIATMIALINKIVTINVSATVESNYVNISGSFNNASLTAGFYWREIGVFAADPNNPNDRTKDILYCYQNAYDTADFIPLASVETIEKVISVPVIVGDVSSVTATIDSSLIFATQQYVQQQIGNVSVATQINGATAKTAPDDNDVIPILDSSASNALKKLSWSNLKAALKAAFDSLYAAVAHTHTKSQITDFPTSLTPTAHAASHKTGGTDAIAPVGIGAAATSHTHTKSQISDFPSSMTPSAHATTHSSGGSDPITISNMAGTLPISMGGTGATTAAGAKTNLGISAGLWTKIRDITDTSGNTVNVSVTDFSFTTYKKLKLIGHINTNSSNGGGGITLNSLSSGYSTATIYAQSGSIVTATTNLCGALQYGTSFTNLNYELDIALQDGVAIVEGIILGGGTARKFISYIGVSGAISAINFVGSGSSMTFDKCSLWGMV
jgi:hypothetical protein